MEYPVKLDNQQVGTATLEQKGLYARIFCSCRGLDGKLYSVSMRYPDKTVPLGVLVSEGEAYVLRKSIPAKFLGQAEPVFLAAAREQTERIALQPGKPFPKLGSLRKAKFCLQDGKRYLEIS